MAILFLVTGCEKLTASLDGLNKEETVEPKIIPESTEQESEKNISGLTGSVVTETEKEVKSTTHTVKMTSSGFNPDKLYIKLGDTVVWENVRSGKINKAMIIGVRECRQIRSDFLKSGESFSWTFIAPVTCTIADGVMTTKESKIVVEKDYS